ncbi:L domain-like protein [Cutaneotrichosporon oleaginosum]|uniref:U2 small nuclear ribonucleoprotein A' n=1 Tax=Cutaneotrichosporon oleaginosum TaxID=879819 RepID=A0A0J1BB64_9TREE|nr:L domain-like protein [Cutaneotrichosporon oleaginosum]KLT45224.1 L domain-like protein [Cutaneotrichosporon oleaginosum]TXT14941.1 hypothetical protein COLE_01134 [Cutaneotrichosporon oleaginosum]
MRLTPEFVSNTHSHLNPLKERELDLRGLAIPVIENLASHQGTYDTLNLTDNSLTVLGNIPQAHRLHTVHAAQNQISSISPALATNLPNLTTLVLSDNALASLSSLLPLADTPLRYLSLRGNPVTAAEHYRAFVIWKVGRGALHVLDFERVKDAERARAKELFEDSSGAPNELARKLSTSTAGVSGAALAAAKAKGGKGRLMTPEEKKRVVEALTRANTAEEVRKLERMLADGVIPEGGMEGVDGEE